MAFDGWFSLGGVEIINNARTAAAMRANGLDFRCDDCPELWYPLKDPNYAGDPFSSQPWAEDSGSAGFLGIVGLDIVGIGNSTARRVVTPYASDGASVGVVRRSERQMTFRVMIVGMSVEAANYGLAWLASVLRGSACGTGNCAGDTLCFYGECPSSFSVGPTLTPDQTHDKYARFLYQVGVMEPPVVEQYVPLGSENCADPTSPGVPQGIIVNFTLVAGVPYIYKTPSIQAIIKGDDWQAFTPSTDPCPVPDPCPTLTCSTAPPPPSIPIPVDPCSVPPPATQYMAYMINIEPAQMSDWFEKVPLIEFDGADSFSFDWVHFVFYPNQTGSPFGCELDNAAIDSCLECGRIYTPLVNKLSKTVIDGRTQTAVQQCFGETSPSQTVATGVYTSAPLPLYGKPGELFQWPVFDCGAGLCVLVYIMYRDPAGFTLVGDIKFSLVDRMDAA